MKVKSLQNTRENVENTNNSNYSKNEELIKREDIKDSPFTMITTEEGTFGVMGKYRITEFGTTKEVKAELKKITWNRIIQVIMLINENNK